MENVVAFVRYSVAAVKSSTRKSAEAQRTMILGIAVCPIYKEQMPCKDVKSGIFSLT